MRSGYLLFLLSGRVFGVKLTGAVEIVPWRRGRYVPLSYSYVEGLIDYRGDIYPVFNLRQRLGLGKQAPIGFAAGEEQMTQKEQSIILLEEGRNPFGISIDTVVKMTSLEETAPAPEKTQGLDARFIKGLVYEDNQEIVLLDFERLFFHGS